MMRTQDTTSHAFSGFVGRGRPPVIMQVLPALVSGGVEQGVVDLSAAIVKAGGKSIVVSSGGIKIHDIAKGGGLHIALPVHSKNPLVIAANVARLRALIREHNVDIVHACSRAPAWSASRAVIGTAARFVTSCHSAHKITGALKKMYNSSIAKGERVIAVSHFISDYLTENYGLDSSLVRVLHRGVPVEKFHPNSVSPERLIRISQGWRIPEGAAVVMLPARLSRIKGHMFLLDAIERLQRRDVFCLFLGSDAGNEKYRESLESYIDSKNMGGITRIVTDCNDMPAAYMLSTVVVCPSLVPEGFGRVAIEAQAMGRPVIATDHGGTRETILRDETGWLIPPGDVGALANALQEAMALDARGRALLGTRAMAHVAKHFTNEGMCAGTLDVYAELLDSRPLALPSNDARAARKAG